MQEKNGTTEDHSEPRSKGPRDYEYNSIRTYLKEIGQVKLLTREQQTELAKRVRKGDGQARENMIKANLRWVVHIAKKYQGLGLPLDDLINEGNIGLMKAVDRFEWERGNTISTYSKWWIVQKIKLALANKAPMIRFPIYLMEKITNYRRVYVSLEQACGGKPTDEEMADALGVSLERAAYMRRMTFDKVTSLDAPVGDDSDGSIRADLVKDERVSDPGEAVASHDMNEVLAGVLLDKLTPREHAIMTERYGLNGGIPKTLEQIGAMFDVTRERIRQIEVKVLIKLRHPSVMKLLQSTH